VGRGERLFGPTLTTRTVAAALRDLEHPKAEVRAAAASDLGRTEEGSATDAVAALLRALDDEEPRVRAAAAEGLATRAPAEAVEPLLACAEDDEPHVRELALLALGAIRSPEAAARLGSLAEDPEPRVRFQALIAYARSATHREVLERLVAATHDRDPLVAHIALRLAEELGDDRGPVAPAIVLRCLELVSDEAVELRAAAAVILARAGRTEGYGTLLALVSRTLETTQLEDEAAAIELVGELGLKEALPLLRRRTSLGAFGLGGDPLAWQARVALARLGDGRQRRWILSELTSWDRERRTLAAAAAGRARLAEARPLLEAMRGDAGRADPEAVELALDELEANRGK